MATIKFLYRSTRQIANLTLRFQHRNNEKKDIILDYKTEIDVLKTYWNEEFSKNYKDIDKKQIQKDLKSKLDDLEFYVLKEFKKIKENQLSKEWLKNIIDNYYNPQIKVNIPTNLIGFIEYYIDDKKELIKPSSIVKLNVIKHKLERFELFKKQTYLINDIDENFKQDFINFLKDNNYSQNTMQRDLTFVKTFCKHARFLGLDTSVQIENLKVKGQKVDKIYLTTEEIDKIQNTTMPNDYLDNAKDFLIISCYTGQRVSDFLRFNKDMIRIENNKSLLEFTQQKTGKIMTIPLSKKVLEILEKRNGDFPRAISDQRYNEYIKEVCKISGINTPTKGSKINNLRKFEGVFPKYELVTSHIGRRSFASNYYGKIATTYLTYITGHSTEEMFLNYIGKSNKDLALEMPEIF